MFRKNKLTKRQKEKIEGIINKDDENIEEILNNDENYKFTYSKYDKNNKYTKDNKNIKNADFTLLSQISKDVSSDKKEKKSLELPLDKFKEDNLSKCKLFYNISIGIFIINIMVNLSLYILLAFDKNILIKDNLNYENFIDNNKTFLYILMVYQALLLIFMTIFLFKNNSEENLKRKEYLILFVSIFFINIFLFVFDILYLKEDYKVLWQEYISMTLLASAVLSIILILVSISI